MFIPRSGECMLPIEALFSLNPSLLQICSSLPTEDLCFFYSIILYLPLTSSTTPYLLKLTDYTLMFNHYTTESQFLRFLSVSRTEDLCPCKLCRCAPFHLRCVCASKSPPLGLSSVFAGISFWDHQNIQSILRRVWLTPTTRPLCSTNEYRLLLCDSRLLL